MCSARHVTFKNTQPLKQNYNFNVLTPFQAPSLRGVPRLPVGLRGGQGALPEGARLRQDAQEGPRGLRRVHPGQQ